MYCPYCGKKEALIYKALNVPCCFHCYMTIQHTTQEKVTNNSCNGKCSKCMECCTDFIPLTKQEIKRIKTYMTTKEVHRNIATIDNQRVLLCPFISEKGCQIYPVRPKVCRDFCCWNSDTHIYKKKIENIIRADINKDINFISLHTIFFNDIEYDKQIKKNLKRRKIQWKLIK